MNQHTSPRIEFVIEGLLAAKPRRWPEIAKETGVPESTMRKIARRETKNPRSQTLDSLHAYFDRGQGESQEHDRRTSGRRSTDHAPQPVPGRTK